MQLEIKTTIDAFNPKQVKALNDFLTAIGGHSPEETTGKTLKQLDDECEKPKATRKKAEKVDPSFYNLEDAQAPKTNLPNPEGTQATFAAIAAEPEVVEAIEVVEPETVSAPTLMQIRSLVAQKAGEHKDAIKSKLVELGAQNVSTLDAKHFQTIFDFLTEL